MVWRRVFGLAVVFALGVGVGGALLYSMDLRRENATEAQRRALAILDRQPQPPSSGESPIVRAVKRIAPAVVNIDTVGRVSERDDTGASFYVDQEVRGKGSGVVLTSDGYIVTNNHVIEGASRVKVTFPDGHWYYAQLIGRDLHTDLAVLRVPASNLTAAELGDSDRLQVGEWSIAVGNPLGLGSSTTVGVISALNRRNLQLDEGRNLDGAIQTDAAINRGNSGGALANIDGQLVGINTAILSANPNGGSIGLGFAIPINTVRHVARELIAGATPEVHVARAPWLGIQFGPVPENESQALGLNLARGAQVVRVLPETPASMAGIEDEDILLSIDGQAIGDMEDVRNAVMRHKAGEKATLHILRPADHRERDIPVTVQERPNGIPIGP
jgi:S1-C subfamily serine protease